MKKIINILLILLSTNLFAQITPEQLFESASKNCYVVINKAGNSIGTGFLITNGYIITNHHVVDGASPTEITLKPINNTNEIIACEKLFVSSKRDIAIIKPLSKIENEGLELDTVFPKIGSGVYVIGNSEGLTGTFSNGLVSQVREEEGLDAWIQISAPISHGNSGGPVMNAKGKVIGMSTMGLIKGQNLNFALPTKYISAFLRTNGIGADVVNSEEEGKPKDDKSKAQAELDEVRALFTPEQLELAEEVDDLYFKRNFMVFFFSTIFTVALIILIIAHFKGKLKQWLDRDSGGNKPVFIRLFIFIFLPLIAIPPIYVLKNNYYPPFFKSKLVALSIMSNGDINDEKLNYDIKDNGEIKTWYTKLHNERKVKLYYSFLLNETYNGNDTALFFLADGIWRGELIEKADTVEAQKWFNTLARKNYYAGYLYNAECALNGWQSKDVKQFKDGILQFVIGYTDFLLGIVNNSNANEDEKTVAKAALVNILGMAQKKYDNSWAYSGYYPEKNCFVDPFGKIHYTSKSMLSHYDWLSLFVRTKKEAELNKNIPSHAYYLNGQGALNKKMYLEKSKNIILPWVMAKDFFIKAKGGKEVKYNRKSLLFNQSIARWSKKDSDIDYYLKTIEEINRVWQEDLTVPSSNSENSHTILDSRHLPGIKPNANGMYEVEITDEEARILGIDPNK